MPPEQIEVDATFDGGEEGGTAALYLKEFRYFVDLICWSWRPKLEQIIVVMACGQSKCLSSQRSSDGRVEEDGSVVVSADWGEMELCEATYLS